MNEKPYDLAVSFAGEHRNYVARTVEACKALGLKVFYDKDKSNDWWGGNFIREQRAVYSSQTQFFVPFISTEYLAKPIPMDEFSAAMMTAVKQGDDYVLPVLMDDVRVPADLLHPHTHYLRASDYSPEELARQLQQKVGRSREAGTPPAELGPVVEHALQLRLPRVARSDWSKYEELDRLFNYLTMQFTNGAKQLRERGFICTVKPLGDRLMIRVERNGETVYGLDFTKGGGLGWGDHRLTWSIDQPSYSANSYNGWATPIWDREQDTAAIQVTDMALGGRLDDDQSVSPQGFFLHFWDRMIDQIERRAR
jgi:hypothetical protein